MNEINESKISNMISFVFKKVIHDWKYILIAIISLIITASLQFVTPQVTQNIIDNVIPNKKLNQLFFNLLILFVVTILLSLLGFVSTYLISLVSQGAISELRTDLYSHVLNQDFSFFEDQKTGDIMTRLTSDVGAMQSLISTHTLSIISDAFTFVCVLIFIFIKDWKLTVMIILTFPLLFISNKFFIKYIKSAFKKVRESFSNMNNQLQKTLTSMLLIKNYGTEDFEINNYNKLNTEYKKNNLETTKLQGLFIPIVSLINTLGVIIVLGYGSYTVIQGKITVGQVMAYLSYLKLLQNPVRSFTGIINLVQQAYVSYERIEELLNINPKILDKKNNIDFPVIKNNIEFKNVSFYYEESQLILDNLNFKIPFGETTALVGSSGSGKTTITKLISRLYEATNGEILIDNINLKDFSINSLRTNIGIVSQNVELLDGTIKDNIIYGSFNATEEEIILSAKQGNILEFINSLPKKFETEIGEQGIKLSGGQKQRVAIARAFLKKSQIIILDEATASLDNESEYKIQKSLDVLLKNKTCLVIAHRFSTIHNSDNIIVLENGKIVEEGNHKRLINLNGRYKELYNIQFID